MQEEGITVLPNLPLLHTDYAECVYRELLPRGVPLAAQIQTAMRSQWDTRDKASLGATAACLQTAIEAAQAPELLLYGSKRVFDAIVADFPYPAKLRFVANISSHLNGAPY
jgi:hypothetical protein